MDTDFFVILLALAHADPVLLLVLETASFLIIALPLALACYFLFRLFKSFVSSTVDKQRLPQQTTGEWAQHLSAEPPEEVSRQNEPFHFCTCGARLNSPGAYCAWCGQGVKTSPSVDNQPPGAISHCPVCEAQQTEPAALIYLKTAVAVDAATMPTPSAIYRKAPVDNRFYASLADSAITLIPLGVNIYLALLFYDLLIWLNNYTQTIATVVYVLMTIPLGVTLLLGYISVIAYWLLRDGLEGGAGFGKRWFGLMVVHLKSNRPCTLKQSLLRNLILIPPIDALVIWLGDRGQRIGDLLADTQVIEMPEFANSMLEKPKLLALYPKAPITLRFCAKIWDIGLAILPVLILYVVMAVIMEVLFLKLNVGSDAIMYFGFIPALFGLAAFGCVFLAIVYLFCKDGRTGGASFGKRRFGLMVVNIKKNRPCTPFESFLRQAGSCTLLAQIVDVFMAQATGGGLTTGDMVAGTQVILSRDFRSNP